MAFRRVESLHIAEPEKDFFQRILQIRCHYEKSEIIEDFDWYRESLVRAHIEGKEAQRSGKAQEIPELLRNVVALRDAWLDGWKAAIAGGGWELQVVGDEYYLDLLEAH